MAGHPLHPLDNFTTTGPPGPGDLGRGPCVAACAVGTPHEATARLCGTGLYAQSRQEGWSWAEDEQWAWQQVPCGEGPAGVPGALLRAPGASVMWPHYTNTHPCGRPLTLMPPHAAALLGQQFIQVFPHLQG